MAAQSLHLQDELRKAKEDLKVTVNEIKNLQGRKRELEEKISTLKCQLDLLSTAGSAVSEYDCDTFSWSNKMTSLLKSVFKIDNFRSYQKAAINATMSNLDCLLIMPTGGGKSLCFQLPALLSPGVTVVVSPLISLMEDQLQAMNEIGIPTHIFNSQTHKEETKVIFDSMVNANAKMKLLYVTPEKLAKSKRLMSQLEKMYRAGRFSRLVIDEVHCCSQWGHDFRPDYKFLGIMKTQYPKTPILGLTATATPNVIVDVQKILNIEGCLVFKDTFFRPNLKYEVIDCGESATKVDEIAQMIKSRFKGQSGIVYCLTIKDCEDVASKLRELGIKADRYHAQLEPDHRSKIQKKWYSDGLQVIVATVAFGMGINKLDVRFVIHHSLSKSVENYYQETGRAGRDGELAHCILLYKFGDVFRASSLMFTEKSGVSNVYNMLRYCLDRSNCRKGLLAQHFGDAWELSGCGEMCDNCERTAAGQCQFKDINAGPLLDDLERILEHATGFEERMTPLKLLDSWLGRGNKKLRVDCVNPPKFHRQTCEAIIAMLLVDGYLKEDFHFTPYSTISYLVPGAKSVLRHGGRSGQEIALSMPNSLISPMKITGSKLKTDAKEVSSSVKSTKSPATTKRPSSHASANSSKSSSEQHLSKKLKTDSSAGSNSGTRKSCSVLQEAVDVIDID